MRGAGSRCAAEKALAAYVLTRDDGPKSPAGPEEMSVGEVLALYAQDVAPDTADPARIGYAIKALAPFWGGLPCSMIVGSNCRAYAKQRNRASGTVRRELGVLQAAVNHAHKEGRLTSAAKVSLSPHGAPKDRWLTRDEAARLLRELRRNKRTRHAARFLILGLYTGSRPRTVLSTTWSERDDGPWVDLEAGIYHRKGRQERQTRKRRGSCRMPGGLVAHLQRWRRAEGGDFIVEYKGKPVSDVGKALEAACARAGIERITPHTIKHTAITWFFQAGGTMEDAADYFSTSAQTLEAVYRQHSVHYQDAASRLAGRGGRRG